MMLISGWNGPIVFNFLYKNGYICTNQDTLSALDAITEAQRIAFAPMLFQAALCLRNAGILDYLDQQGKQELP